MLNWFYSVRARFSLHQNHLQWTPGGTTVGQLTRGLLEPSIGESLSVAPLQCRTLLLSPQGRYLHPTPPPGVESGPTPTNQRLSLRHSRPHSADSSEGPTRAISQGWDVDGSLLLLGGLGKSLQLHSGPHLGSGQVLDTKSPPNGCCSYRSSSSPSKRKWRGSAQGPA